MTFHSHGKLKNTDLLWGNEGIDRGNLTLTVGILSVKSRNYNAINAVFIMNVKLNVKIDLLPSTLLNPGCQRVHRKLEKLSELSVQL